MKKRTFLIVLTLLLAGACSKEDCALRPAPDAEPAVGVRFGLELAVETDTSLVPMTRAASYTNWIANDCRLLILKKIDTRWIVDTVKTVKIDPQSKETELKFTGDLPACPFALEMRPGDYRVVAVLNWSRTNWNEKLIHGVVVADENNAALPVPPLVTYTISTHFMNNGYRQLSREIFVAVADFTVPKSSDLHGTGMPQITLQAQRRVGKFRILLKDKDAPNGLNYESTQHTFRGIFTSLGAPFPEGIDALGGMYRSEAGLFELPWCLCTNGYFHYSGTEAYQTPQTNATIFSPFVFVGPEEEIPFEISNIGISGMSSGLSYKTDEVFTRTLAASRITGIVFETTSTIDLNTLVVDLAESTDSSGKPEDAVGLFDQFFEWNAEYDKNIKER